ncbi:MAG: tryptophan-rich sensory protein [Propionibacteriaceae bacterium]
MTRVLVTGATGYIGSLLVPKLLAAGYDVRVLTRSAARLNTDWSRTVEVAEGDATDEDALQRAFTGCDVAYFLIHSMDGHGDFVERDRNVATGFARAARETGISRIVYLSGLHPAHDTLSPHLGSRVEVGEILLSSGVPTAVLQAGVVLGEGSASFDILRHLTERIPGVIGPKWLRNRIQPIAVDDALYYLVAAASLPPEISRTIDIGGREVLTYAQMMKRYASVTGLYPRPIVTVPVLTPWLASLWMGFVTPVDTGVARPLVGSLIHEAVCHDNDAESLMGLPPGGLTGFDEAIRRAGRSYDPLQWSRVAKSVGAGVAACVLVGSLLTDPKSAWYTGLRKPSWTPPAAAIPVVWTTLYGLIWISSTVTISELLDAGKKDEASAFAKALAVNLVINAGWSGLFFRAHRLPLAAVVSGLLAASSADLSRRAAATGEGKAGVFGLYAAWCTFTTALTARLATLNKGRG